MKGVIDVKKVCVLGTVSFLFLMVVVFSSCSLIQVKWNTTQEKKVVEYDPAIKKNIRGSLSIAYAWGEQLSPPSKYLRGLINLKEAMQRWTNINTELQDHLRLSSQQLLEMPFVYVTTNNAFELTDTEKANVRNYLLHGGFMVLDNPTPSMDRSQSEASLKKMMRDVLGAQARFKPIPNDHEIYHSYFDFDDGPPKGSEEMLETGILSVDKDTGKINKAQILPRTVNYLEGIWIDNRLVAVFSNKGYIVRWNELSGNDPQLKMGVNMVVFALTQSGGIGTVE